MQHDPSPTEQIRSALISEMNTRFPQFKLCDSELGQNGEHGWYKLGETGCLQFVANAECLCVALTGKKGFHDSLVVVKEECENLMRFELKLVTADDRALSVVNCIQYRDAHSPGFHFHIYMSSDQVSMALAVLETVLLDFV